MIGPQRADFLKKYSGSVENGVGQTKDQVGRK